MMFLFCKGVLFDCDGVLVDSDASVKSAWTRWAGDLGLDPVEVYRMAHGRRSEDTVALLVPPEARREQTERIDRYELEDAASVRAVAGASSLTSAMPSGTWAVVTSGRAELARARLGAAGLPVPPALVTADDVARGKPDPEGYMRAAKLLGIAPSEAIVIEDAGAGIRAARAADVAAVIGVGERAAGQGADLEIADLSELNWDGEGLCSRK